MTLVMAAIVLTGFMPTLFGRAFFPLPKMQGYFYLHGMVLSAWFALLVTQAALAGNGRLEVHRKIGWAALAFAVLIPVMGMGVQLAMPGRIRAAGADLTPFIDLIQNIFWLNAFSSLQFVGFIGAAILLRKRSESHKRLMLFGSIAIILPAAARFARWPVFGNTLTDLSQPSSTGSDVIFALGGMALLVGAIIVNDLVAKRRLHRVTIIGAVIFFVMTLLVPLIANSEGGKAIVWALSGGK
ncbi:MAG: hypothetical protein ABI616_03535 [Pseudomonadota bacterium]